MNLSVSWKELLPAPAGLDIFEASDLPENIQEQLFCFCVALKEYNSHTNLVANADWPQILQGHILDSLTLLPWIRRRHLALNETVQDDNLSLVDIGSGAGFPGLVLAIVDPQLDVVLVESVGKKCRFLQSVVDKLDLSERVYVKQERAETLAHQSYLREQFDFATARAVGALPVVAELCLPFLRIGGVLLAQRSRKQAESESSTVESSVKKFGGRLFETVSFETDSLGRDFSLTIIEKSRPTSRRYPRSPAQIKQK